MDRATTVLIAEDQASTREATARALREAGYHTVLAADGQEALERIATERPDIVVLDVVMPRLGGLEVCRTLKQRSRGDYLPVLFLSSRADPAARVEGLRAGGDDFMAKPYDPDELRARVEALLRTRRLFEQVGRTRAELDPSQHDPLTGLFSGRYLTTRLDEEFRRAERFNEPLSLMAIDLDGFALVNGRWGRGVGDRLLEACARSLARACRDVDVVARPGSDEFVVLLPDLHFTGCAGIAERVWRELRDTHLEEGGARIACDASVGVACYPGRDVASPRDLLRLAHAALARAKAEGRGKICLYQHQGYLFQPH